MTVDVVSGMIVPSESGQWEMAETGKAAPDMLRASQVSEILDGCWWTAKGLIMPETLTYERWEQIGSLLQFVEQSVQFAIGDWIRFGERRYGERYAQAVTETPYSHGTLRNYAWVAGHITLSRRRDNLPFGHHQAVASLDAEDQERLLDEAEQHHLSVRDLRRMVGVRPPTNPTDLDEIAGYLDAAQRGLIRLSESLPAAEIRAVLDALDGVLAEMRTLRHIATAPQKRRATLTPD